MPIGIGTAIGIGGAVLGAGASIYGASKSASAQKQAAQSAADTSLQVAQQNNDLFREIYGQNLGLASPYYNNGLLAGNALTDLLLGTHTYNPAIVSHPTVPGGGTFPTTTPALGPGTGTPASGYSGPTLQQIFAMDNDGISGNGNAAVSNYLNYYAAHPGEDPGYTDAGRFDGDGFHDLGQAQSVLAAHNSYVAAHPAGSPTTPALGTPTTPTTPAVGAGSTVPLANRGEMPKLSDYRGDIQGFQSAMAAWRTTPAAGTTPPATGTPAPATGATGGVTTPAPTAQSAWDAFRNGTNYTWRLGQGENALASNYAAHGAFDSGAEKKALLEYGQNFASNELSNYMNLLAGQQAAGLSAAGAVMGVGTNYAGNVAAQNTSAANAAANAALVAGQGQAGTWGAIGSGIGQIGGALTQYGLGQPGTTATYAPAGGYQMGGGTNNYFQAHPFG